MFGGLVPFGAWALKRLNGVNGFCDVLVVRGHDGRESKALTKWGNRAQRIRSSKEEDASVCCPEREALVQPHGGPFNFHFTSLQVVKKHCQQMKPRPSLQSLRSKEEVKVH